MLIDSRGTHSLEQCLHLLHTVLEARDITRVEVDVSRKPRKFEWGTNAFGGPLGREASLRGDERHGKIVEDAYVGAQVGAGLITLHAIGADVVGGRWAVALCFPTAT